MMDDLGSDIGVRFAHLLQPIRDLTKNWDINVAAQLEEYLSELEQITITFDGGVTTMNFAEAALLIQGSAGVYSRKVEYLYALVYQTLDLIAAKKKSAQPKSSNQDGGNEGTEQSCVDKDTTEEFLTLDDIKEAANVEMVEDKPANTNPMNKTMSTVVPRTPMALTPFSDMEKITNTPLYNKSGELLGNRMDFKMNTSSVHRSGALLLEPTNQIVLELDREGIGITGPGPDMEGVDQTCPVGKEALPEGNHPLEDMEVDCHDDCNDDPQEPHDTGLSPDQRNDKNMSKHEETPPSRRHVKSVWDEEPENTPQQIDLLLDPHEEITKDRKPFKKGSTQKLPLSLKEKKKPTSRKRRKSSTESHPPTPSSANLSEFLYHAFYSYSSQFPKSSFNAPSTSEFEPEFWSEQKRRKSLKSKENAKVAQLRKSVIHEEKSPDRDDDVEDGGCGTEEDNMSPKPFEPEMPGGDDDKLSQVAFDKLLENAETQGEIEPIAIDDCSHSMPDSVEVGEVVQSYEEMVRRYVQSTLTAAVSYAQETELSRRVREWEERIKPTLLKEEQMDVFDIHLYGSDIVSTLDEKQKEGSEKCEFKQLASKKEPSEICRMFAASLQLANDCNVHIMSEGIGEEAVDTMSLTLLSSTMARDLITNYRASSGDPLVASTHSPSSIGEENRQENVQEKENAKAKFIKNKKIGRNTKKQKR